MSDPSPDTTPSGPAVATIEGRLLAVGSTRRGSDWFCPTHEDKGRSLTVQQGDRIAGAIIKCGAGCETTDVLRALGLSNRHLYDADPDTVVDVDRYVYRDEEGNPLFRVVKERLANGKKRFRQAGSNGQDGWRKGKRPMEGVRLVLWRLPKLQSAIGEGTEIHLSEGEKDVVALAEAGVFATCHPMGAGKWRPEYTASLAGAASVVVWADRDGPGYRCAHQRLSALLAAGLPATARLPLPEHKGADVFDHLEAGHSPADGKPVTLEELAALVEGAQRGDGEDRVLRDIRALVLASNDAARDHMGDIVDDEGLADIPAPEFIIDQWVPRGVYTVLYGEPGVKKTFAMLGMSRAVRRGTRWQDHKTRKGAVLFYQGEGLAQLKNRAAAWDSKYPLRKDQSMEPGGFLERFVDLTKPQGVAAIVRTVRRFEEANQTKVELLVVDPLVEFMTGDENGEGMDLATKGLRALAMYLDIGVVVGHHTNASGERARGADFHRMRAGAFMPMEELGDEQVGIWQKKQKNAEQVAVILDVVEHADSLVLEWVENLPVSAYAILKESEKKHRKETGQAKVEDAKRKKAGSLLLAAIEDKPGSSQTALLRACKGRGVGAEFLVQTLEQMVKSDVVRVEKGPRDAQLHYPIV